MKMHWSTFRMMFMLSLAFSFLAVSCDNDNMDDVTTVASVVAENANFSILADALEAADLTDAVNDRTATLTVFAPTNAAFEAFLSANGFSSLSDIPTATLRQVLLYHVLGVEANSTALKTDYYNTLAEFEAGEPLSLFVNTDGGVSINGAVDVTAADTEVDNGVIHTVNAVIAPANVVTFATANPNFSSLVAALTRSDLTVDFVGTLTGDGPFTVFAPTNEAFANLLASNNEWNTLADIPVATLEAVLSYHVVAGANVRAGDLTDDQSVTTFEGSSFTIDLDGGPSIIAGSNTANIVATDVQGTNGVVHAIDAVILP